MTVGPECISDKGKGAGSNPRQSPPYRTSAWIWFGKICPCHIDNDNFSRMDNSPILLPPGPHTIFGQFPLDQPIGSSSEVMASIPQLLAIAWLHFFGHTSFGITFDAVFSLIGSGRFSVHHEIALDTPPCMASYFRQLIFSVTPQPSFPDMHCRQTW